MTEVSCDFHHYPQENAEIVPQKVHSYLAGHEIPCGYGIYRFITKFTKALHGLYP
jgi:hypothetical protein